MTCPENIVIKEKIYQSQYIIIRKREDSNGKKEKKMAAEVNLND